MLITFPKFMMRSWTAYLSALISPAIGCGIGAYVTKLYEQMLLAGVVSSLMLVVLTTIRLFNHWAAHRDTTQGNGE